MTEPKFENFLETRESRVQRGILQALYVLWEIACNNQVEPDEKNCTICGNNDHQAFECRFNAFVVFKELAL